jgi:hypothetical protein
LEKKWTAMSVKSSKNKKYWMLRSKYEYQATQFYAFKMAKLLERLTAKLGSHDYPNIVKGRLRMHVSEKLRRNFDLLQEAGLVNRICIGVLALKYNNA